MHTRQRSILTLALLLSNTIMSSTYIKNYRLPADEGSGFVGKMMIMAGDDKVHELDLEKYREHLQKDPAVLPKEGAVHPLTMTLASNGTKYVRRTSMGVITITTTP